MLIVVSFLQLIYYIHMTRLSLDNFFMLNLAEIFHHVSYNND